MTEASGSHELPVLSFVCLACFAHADQPPSREEESPVFGNWALLAAIMQMQEEAGSRGQHSVPDRKGKHRNLIQPVYFPGVSFLKGEQVNLC